MPETTHLLIANLDAETSRIINALCQTYNVRLTALCRDDLLAHDLKWWVFGRHVTVDAIIISGHLPHNGYSTVAQMCHQFRTMHPKLTIIVVSDDESLSQTLQEQDAISFIHNNGNGTLGVEVAKYLHLS